MKTEICAGGFLLKKKKFLFGKRSKKKSWAPGLWDIAGGHSKKGENPIDTLKRETLEEIGVNVIQAEFITVMNIMDESKNEIFKYYIYLITEWTGKPKNCSNEHSKLRWFKRSELKKANIALPQYLPLIDKLSGANF